MNFFHHKDLGNHLLQLCPKVVKHPVYNAVVDTIYSALVVTICTAVVVNIYSPLVLTICTALWLLYI